MVQQAGGEWRQKPLEKNISDKASVQTSEFGQINPLETKRRLLGLKTQSVPRSKHTPSLLYKPVS